MSKLRAFLALTALALSFNPSPAKAGFGGHIGGHLGIGNLSGGDVPIRNTSVGTLDLQLMPGYRLMGKSLMVGPLINLRYLSQLYGSNEPGKNIGGTGSLIGLALDYEFSVFKVIASWDLRARHHHDTPDTSYQGSGYTLLFGYKTMGDFFMDLMLNRTSYNTRQVGEEISHFNAAPLVHWNLAIGLSYSF